MKKYAICLLVPFYLTIQTSTTHANNDQIKTAIDQANLKAITLESTDTIYQLSRDKTRKGYYCLNQNSKSLKITRTLKFNIFKFSKESHTFASPYPCNKRQMANGVTAVFTEKNIKYEGGYSTLTAYLKKDEIRKLPLSGKVYHIIKIKSALYIFTGKVDFFNSTGNIYVIKDLYNPTLKKVTTLTTAPEFISQDNSRSRYIIAGEGTLLAFQPDSGAITRLAYDVPLNNSSMDVKIGIWKTWKVRDVVAIGDQIAIALNSGVVVLKTNKSGRKIISRQFYSQDLTALYQTPELQKIYERYKMLD